MNPANTPTSYGSVARALHWLTAALILAAIPAGLVANALPEGTDAELARKAYAFSLHKTLGIAAFFAALLRVGWALTQARPVPLHPDRRLETRLAAATHAALYIGILATPLTGWLHHAATQGFAPILWPFGQSLPFVPTSPALASLFAALHWTFTKLLGLAVLLHIAGALRHALAPGDGTLARMLRGTPAGDPGTATPATAPALAAAALWLAALGTGLALAPAAPPRDTAVATSEASQWTVESGTLAITIRQLGQPVTGTFAAWSADIAFDPDAPGPDKGSTTVRVDIASLTLGSVTGYAVNPDFLDAAAHPEARFEAEILEAPSGYEARGTLTLKGVPLPATLPFTLALDGDTAEAAGTLTLDRRSYGIGKIYADETSLGFPVEVSVRLRAVRRGGS